MGDIGEYWRENKEYVKEKRRKEGWVSNQYKTPKERNKSVLQSMIYNDEEDAKTSENLRELGIKHELKTTHSFALEIEGEKYMLYTGKKGNRLHNQRTKEKWDLGQYYYQLKRYMKDFLETNF